MSDEKILSKNSINDVFGDEPEALAELQKIIVDYLVVKNEELLELEKKLIAIKDGDFIIESAKQFYDDVHSKLYIGLYKSYCIDIGEIKAYVIAKITMENNSLLYKGYSLKYGLFINLLSELELDMILYHQPINRINIAKKYVHNKILLSDINKMYSLYHDVATLKKAINDYYSLDSYRFYAHTSNLLNDINICISASMECDYSQISIESIENVKQFFIEYNSIDDMYLFHETCTAGYFRTYNKSDKCWCSVNTLHRIEYSPDHFIFGLKEIENLIVDFNNYQNKIAATENAVEIALPEQKLSLWQRIKGYIHDRTAS